MQINTGSAISHPYQGQKTEQVKTQPAVQDNAKLAAKTSQVAENSTHSTHDFLADVMEQLLANKIGVDKEKLDELKKDIEALQSLETPTKQQKERLEMLTEKLAEMIKEAAERAAEQETKHHGNKLHTYRSVYAMTSQQ